MTNSPWEKRFKRERLAREQAENLLEEKARELFEMNTALAKSKASLAEQVEAQTHELKQANLELRAEIENRMVIEANLRASRDEALTLNRQKEAFLARVSHEIRTPLNSIIAYAQLLGLNELGEDDAKKIFAIEKSGEMLLTIVNDLLDVSKVDAGKMMLEHSICELHPLIDTVVAMLNPEAEARGILMSLDTSGLLTERVSLDEGRLRQILTNLISNAVKYTDEGSVQISAQILNKAPASTPEGFRGKTNVSVLEFKIKDTGRGIPENRISTLFDPFIRGENVHNTMGTGLGLAISRRLAILMGGSLKVESSEGQGSTFTLEVACQNAEPSKPYNDTESNKVAGPSMEALRNMGRERPLKILTADDNEENRSVLESMLEYLGYKTDLVNDGLDAIHAIQLGDYDVVLLDIFMPNIDGVEVTRRIRKQLDIRQPKIVAATASAIHKDEQKYIEAGMDFFLSKPIDMGKLAEILALVTDDLNIQVPTGNQQLVIPDDLSVIDHTDLQNRLGPLLDDMLEKVSPIFIRELPSRLRKIQLACDNNDKAEMVNVLHALKGSSLSVGAVLLADVCARLQASTERGTLPSQNEISDLTALANTSAEQLLA